MTIRKYIDPEPRTQLIEMPHDPDDGITFYITPGNNISILTRLADKLGTSGRDKLVYGFTYISGGKLRANKGSFVASTGVTSIAKAMKAKKIVYQADSWRDLCEVYLEFTQHTRKVLPLTEEDC